MCGGAGLSGGPDCETGGTGTDHGSGLRGAERPGRLLVTPGRGCIARPAPLDQGAGLGARPSRPGPKPGRSDRGPVADHRLAALLGLLRRRRLTLLLGRGGGAALLGGRLRLCHGSAPVSGAVAGGGPPLPPKPRLVRDSGRSLAVARSSPGKYVGNRGATSRGDTKLIQFRVIRGRIAAECGGGATRQGRKAGGQAEPAPAPGLAGAASAGKAGLSPASPPESRWHPASGSAAPPGHRLRP